MIIKIQFTLKLSISMCFSLNLLKLAGGQKICCNFKDFITFPTLT